MQRLTRLVSFLLTFSFILTANAMVSSGYPDPIEVDYLNFTATLNSDGSIDTAWSAYTGGDLKYYKVVRSTENSNPVYPDDGYIFYSSTETAYTDPQLPEEASYYRVCAITTDNHRYCSNVVEFDVPTADSSNLNCIQVITYAEKDGECKAYSTPCSVPTGWTVVDSCQSETLSNTLSLSVTLKDNIPYLSWNFDGSGSAPKGYKVAISTQNSEPTYPVMSGDTYKYISSEDTKSYHDQNATAGKTHYYRVCVYEGGKCGQYSNAVSVKVPENTNTTSENSDQIENFELEVELKDKKPYLTWDYDGQTTNLKGFKVAISDENDKPTYPTLDGDDSVYLSNKSIRSYRHSDAKEGKVYYYRVCFYYGGGECDLYSNSVTIAVPGESDESNKIYETEAKTNFSDVKAGIWFEDYLSSFVNRGIIEGYSDGTFQPSKTVNRAEMAKMVVKALDVTTETSDMQIFCDVHSSDWFQPYVLHLYFDSIIEGYIGGSCENKRLYKPGNEVTRAEAIKIILTMFNAEIEPLTSADQTGFTDVPNTHWAATYIRTAFSLGIVNGYDDGTFQPGTPLTRAEFVKMLSEAEKVLK